MFNYLRVPDEIYKKSFAIIKNEANMESLPANMQAVAIRLIHSSGMIDLINDIKFSKNCIEAGCDSLQQGKAIFCDVEMVKSGIINVPNNNEIICSLNESQVASHAKKINNTRSAAAIDFWQNEKLKDAIVIIGNAPTALFYLLEKLLNGKAAPALIIAMPVGFVGAAEAKTLALQLKNENKITPEILTIAGRRGGSAMASAALNALVQILSEQ